MKTNRLSIIAFCFAAFAMAACNSNKTETANITNVELPGTVDNEAFASNVESISVMNLQMGDDWSFVDFPEFAVGDNYFYVLEYSQFRLICFDKQTGKRVSARTIKGNGPGEITSYTTMFCIGDTLCIQGSWYKVLAYDKNCNYIGMKHEFEESFYNYQIRPLSNGGFALISPQHPGKAKSLLVTDKSFNTISEYFNTPAFRIYVNPMHSPLFYTFGDIVRFFYCCDNRLYSLCGNSEQCIEFVMPNLLTPEIATNDFGKINDYDGQFGDLAESGKFIHFSYNFDKVRYSSLLDKQTNRVVSINYNELDQGSSNLVLDFFRKSIIMLTDGKYIYAKCKNSRMAEILEGHDDLLDARLKKTQAQYRAYLESNAEFIKDLNSDEREAASVMLKIKLKD